MPSIRTIRRAMLAAWSLLLLGLLAAVSFSHAVALSGRQTYIITGGSMEPTIPLGAVVAVGNVALDRIVPGDVLTLRDGDRPVFTHRVMEVRADATGRPTFVTQGDANRSADPRPVPPEAVLGRVELSVPFLGFLLAMLATPTGIVSVLSGLGSILLAIRLLEDEERELQPSLPTVPAAG